MLNIISINLTAISMRSFLNTSVPLLTLRFHFVNMYIDGYKDKISKKDKIVINSIYFIRH